MLLNEAKFYRKVFLINVFEDRMGNWANISQRALKDSPRTGCYIVT